MNGVAPPHESADPANSNAASAETLTAAGFEVVSKLVKADVTRLGTSAVPRMAACARFFKRAFGWVASAPNEGSNGYEP